MQKNNKTITQLENLLKTSRKYYLGHILLEFSNMSWFRHDDPLLKILETNSCSLVSTDKTLVSRSMRDQSIFYLRLVGDRIILPRKQFGFTKLDKTRELDYWASYIKSLENRHKYIYILIDNHYSGDAIADCILLAKKLKEKKVQYSGFKSNWSVFSSD